MVRRDNASAADLSTELGTTTRVVQFQKSYADGGTYTNVGHINIGGTASLPAFQSASDERLK